MWMKHTDLPDSEPAEVSESAFNNFWQYRGWEETDPPAEPTPEQASRRRAASEPPDPTEQPEEKPAETGGLSRAQPKPAERAAARKPKE